MFRTTAAACLLSATFAIPAFAQGSSQQAHALPQQAQQLVNHLAETNQGEIQLAILAENQASNPAVKAFARLTADDHIEAENNVSFVADQYGVKLSNGLTPQDQKELDQLRQVRGHSFDTTFMREAVSDQQKSLQHLQQNIQSEHNQALRSLLEGMLPIQEQHLVLAQAVDQMVSGGGHNGQQMTANVNR